MKIKSYDIFDTCLIRSCGSPEHIFHTLALEILGLDASTSDILDFALIRANAEKEARKKYNKTEVTINEIYNVCDYSIFTKISNQDILEKELEIEQRSLLGVASLRDKITRERYDGYNIIYISDMYLPCSFLQSILEREGFWEKGDELYVSCEYGKSKRNGDLYKVIKNKYQNIIESWTHHGDNIESDIRIPKRLGIKVRHVNHLYSPYEIMLLDNSNIYNGRPSYLTAGLSRSIVNNIGIGAESLIAADLIAPLYVPFVFNVLSEARKRNISDLYFLARDGQILYDIAVGFKDLFPDIKPHYLYVSRKTIYFPALKNYNDLIDIIDFHKTAKQDPLKVIYNYTGVLLEVKDYSKNKTIKEILEIEEVKRTLEKAHAESKEAILQYFIQEGLASKTKNNKAIVDLRGTAKSLAYINDILNDNGYYKLFGFYFEVTKNRISTNRRINYYSELHDESYKASDTKLSSLYSIFESYYCASNTGRTIGYITSKELIEPIFEDESNQDEITEIYNTNKKAITIWQKHYILNYMYLFNNEIFRIGLNNNKSFASYPYKEYLRPFTHIQFSSTGIERESLVRKLSLKEILKRSQKKDSLSWYTGSFAWTLGDKSRYILSSVQYIKRVFKTLM